MKVQLCTHQDQPHLLPGLLGRAVILGTSGSIVSMIISVHTTNRKTFKLPKNSTRIKKAFATGASLLVYHNDLEHSA